VIVVIAISSQRPISRMTVAVAISGQRPISMAMLNINRLSPTGRPAGGKSARVNAYQELAAGGSEN